MRRVLSAVGVFALLASSAGAQAPARGAAGASFEFSAASVECFEGEASAAAGRCRADDFDLPQVSQSASQGLRVGLKRRDGRMFWFRQSVLRRNAVGLRSLEMAAPPVRGSRISDSGSPRCEEPLGQVAVADTDTAVLGDADAAAVIRAFAAETNCFRVLERVQALDARWVDALAATGTARPAPRPDFYLMFGTAEAASGHGATTEFDKGEAKAAAILVDARTTAQLYTGESEVSVALNPGLGPVVGLLPPFASAKTLSPQIAYREALAALVRQIEAGRATAAAAAAGTATSAPAATAGAMAMPAAGPPPKQP